MWAKPGSRSRGSNQIILVETEIKHKIFLRNLRKTQTGSHFFKKHLENDCFATYIDSD
jgi:hypothetical protein